MLLVVMSSPHSPVIISHHITHIISHRIWLIHVWIDRVPQWVRQVRARDRVCVQECMGTRRGALPYRSRVDGWQWMWWRCWYYCNRFPPLSIEQQVLQTTDLPCLIVHIADTLQGALESFDIIHKLMQEGTALLSSKGICNQPINSPSICLWTHQLIIVLWYLHWRRPTSATRSAGLLLSQRNASTSRRDQRV